MNDEPRNFEVGAVMDWVWFVECDCGEGLTAEATAPLESGVCPACGKRPSKGFVPCYRTRVHGETTDLVQMDPLGRDAAHMYHDRMYADEGRTRELLEVLGVDHASRTVTVGRASDRVRPKGKKRSGKSPTRKVVPVARGERARLERKEEP